MSLLDNIYTFINKFFRTRVEKEEKWIEWTDSRYINGIWYLNESDTIYYNTGSRLDLLNPQSAILSIEDGAWRITTNTTGEKKVNIPTDYFTTDDNVECIMEFVSGVSQPINVSLNTSSNTSVGYFNWNGSSYTFNLGGTSTSVTGTVTEGDVFTIRRLNGVTSVYKNNVLLKSATRNTGSFRFGFYTNYGRVQKWKNIKIRYI